MPTAACDSGCCADRIRDFQKNEGLGRSTACAKMAEKMGFEPTIPFRVYSLSRGAPSTTRPPLRCGLIMSLKNGMQGFFACMLNLPIKGGGSVGPASHLDGRRCRFCSPGQNHLAATRLGSEKRIAILRFTYPQTACPERRQVRIDRLPLAPTMEGREKNG